MVDSIPSRPRGRWAPTPSGLLHVGNARTALVAWLSVRARRGTFVWRLEDLDPPRAVPGTAEAGLEDLAWLGLDWDEGGGRGGAYGPYEQSLRSAIYEQAIERLHAAGRLFPCRRSRRELRDLRDPARAPHGLDGSPPYPIEWRPESLPEDWLEQLRASERPEAALRFRVDPGPVDFDDRILGPMKQHVDRDVGDFVLRRKDGLWAYQLAVVVDDLAMEIDEVVRGQDLLSSTGRQIQLCRALGGKPPTYAHVPMVLAPDGDKLSKRENSLTLRSLREAGVNPETLVGWMAHSLGLLPHPQPQTPADLVADFDWQRIRRTDTVLPEDFGAEWLQASVRAS